MNHYAIMTSIFMPTKAVKKFASMENWQLVVVGDKKTPDDWHYENVIYLSPNEQIEYSNVLANKLPWNHYSRKMLGYLYAIQQGAELIADVDDDNVPMKSWGDLPDISQYKTVDTPGFVNIYQFFSDQFIWPRGFPLDKLKNRSPIRMTEKKVEVGVWQFLANGDPDVDAIYRLLFNHPIEFSQNKPIVLDSDVFCPFNSQNTIFTRDCFPLLYLPSTVSFRFTDILRGYVAQPILWAKRLRLGFGSATMFQERNPHDYMEDFESEIPMYLYAEKAATIAMDSVTPGNSIGENLLSVYKNLGKYGIVRPQEIDILTTWLKNVESYLLN